MEMKRNYEELGDVAGNGGKTLLRDTENSGLFTKRTVADPACCGQLLGKEHLNLLLIQDIEGDVIIEEHFDGIPLNEKLSDGVSRADFADIVVQICDAVEFLSGQKPALYYKEIKPENILVDEGNAVKLINLENASHEGSIEESIKAIGALVSLLDEKLQKRYQSIVENCDGGRYESLTEFSDDVLKASYPYTMRYTAILAGIVAGFFLFYRLYRRVLKPML